VGVHDFSQFRAVLKNRASAISKIAETIVKIVSTAGAETVIAQTPVDTTRAVSNWRVGLYAPVRGEVGPRVPGSVRGSGAASARAAMTRSAVATINGYKGATSVGGVFISNSVPYISVLEHGGVNRRPHGMVAKGLMAMKARARQISIKNSLSGSKPR
jgi:hypothetical protein